MEAGCGGEDTRQNRTCPLLPIPHCSIRKDFLLYILWSQPSSCVRQYHMGRQKCTAHRNLEAAALKGASRERQLPRDVWAPGEWAFLRSSGWLWLRGKSRRHP